MSEYVMKDPALTKWAEELQKEVYTYWRNSGSWPAGVKVFYSPVAPNPELMIISYQPGGYESDFAREDKERFERGDFTLSANEYASSEYRMARRVREAFAFPGGNAILDDSVIFPVIFFRAPSASYWRRGVPIERRRKAEGFCISKVKEIIKRLSPKKILVIGFETYAKLLDLLGSKQQEIISRTGSGKSRLAVRSIIQDVPVLALTHLTSTRGLTMGDRYALRNVLEDWLLNG